MSGLSLSNFLIYAYNVCSQLKGQHSLLPIFILQYKTSKNQIWMRCERAENI